MQAVVDHETWVMNLREANLYDYPIWYKEYSTRQAYEMPSLIPQEWDNYLYKLAENDTIFETYYKSEIFLLYAKHEIQKI